MNIEQAGTTGSYIMKVFAYGNVLVIVTKVLLIINSKTAAMDIRFIHYIDDYRQCILHIRNNWPTNVIL